jgi:HK97 family phage major capsid protein
MELDVQLKAVEAQVMETHKDLKSWIEKSNDEIKNAGSVAAETKNAIDKVAEKANDLADRLVAMEQKAAAHYEGAEEVKSIGDTLIDSEEFKNVQKRRAGSARVEFKTAIVNAVPSMTQPLVAGHRLDGIVTAPNRPLRVRDILRVSRTTSNIVWFAKENVFTNSAAVVVGGSPTIGSGAGAENVTKPESAITFTSDSENVVTIAHFIPISKQVMDDSAQLASHVNGRLMYGLKLVEEDQLVNGAGTLGTITGLYTARTAYSQAQSPNEYTTRIDYIADAIRQAESANYTPNAILLNPQDWWTMVLAKDSESRYLIGQPQGVIPRTLWGLPVVTTNTMTAGRFLVMDTNSCEIWDRQDASVEVSYEDSVNFQKNMITVRAEERIAFTVYQAGGIIGGLLPAA